MKNATPEIAEWQYSYRNIVVGVFTFSVFFTGLFYLMDVCQTYVPQAGPPWLRDLGIFVFSITLLFFVLRHGPPWLAWRILRLLRHPLPALFVFWLSCERKATLVGFGRLVAASLGRDPFCSRPPPSTLRKKLRSFFLQEKQSENKDENIDSWAIAAMALQAELAADPEKAERYLRSFRLARRFQIPRLVRIFAFEQFALHSARRCDWEHVAAYAAFGSGRSMPLLQSMAKGHLGGQVNQVLLCLYWLIAPCRFATLPHLRSLLKLQAAPAGQAGEEAAIESFQIRHLRLLEDAAAGRPIRLATIIDLALAWQSLLTPENNKEYLTRGVAISARNSHEAVAAISENLLNELEELAVVGKGMVSDKNKILENWEERQDSLTGTLIMRLRNRLFRTVEESAGKFYQDEKKEVPPLLHCWESWLAMHDATERLAEIMGTDDIATAWYGGLQTKAWNGACSVFNTYGKKNAWISYLMFSWVVSVAEKVEDEEACKINQANIAACGIPLYTANELILSLPKRAFGWFAASCRRLKSRS